MTVNFSRLGMLPVDPVSRTHYQQQIKPCCTNVSGYHRPTPDMEQIIGACTLFESLCILRKRAVYLQIYGLHNLAKLTNLQINCIRIHFFLFDPRKFYYRVN